MSYEVGSILPITWVVKDSSGNLADPTTNVVTVTLPDQTTANPAIVRDSLGTFHADYILVQEGLHRISIVTTDPVHVSTDFVNAVDWRSVISVAEAKDFIKDDAADSDPILRHIMAAATELAESRVGICVPRRFVAESIPGRERAVIRVPHPPLLSSQSLESITSVWTSGPIWATADLIVYPDSGTCEPLNMIPFWLGPWRATYTAGRAIISQSIQLAVKEIIYDLWSIHRPYGAVDLEPGPEDTARFEQLLASYRIPPHAEALLEPESQPGFA